jgi:HSP20 family molecular chaperone IbpA
MGKEPSSGDLGGDNATTVRPGQVVRGQPVAQWAHEIRAEGDRLLITIDCAHLAPEAVRYSIGRRYVVVWAAMGPRSAQHVVLLPEAVVPADHVVSHTNGVLDLSVKRRQA